MARRVMTRASKKARKEQPSVKKSGATEERANDDKATSLMGAYLDELAVERNASAHTIRSYRCDLEAFLRWCARKDVDFLTATHRDLRAYLADMDAARYARTTINRRLSSLHGFYAWMNVVGACEVDPASALSGPKIGKHLPHVLKPKDMVRLLSVYSPKGPDGAVRNRTAVETRNQAILEFLYACGARISEAAGLKLGDIDFSSKLVKVLGKGNKQRIIPLHDFCIDALQTYITIARPELASEK